VYPASDLMQEKEQRIVGRCEVVALLGGRRVKDLGDEQRLQLRHKTGELPLDALSRRGQDVTAAVANQELVVEQSTKSRERAAHRRLAETRPPRRSCHMPLLEQGREREQQVQIYDTKMRHKHVEHTKHSFDA
jgi:hypothetical protein